LVDQFVVNFFNSNKRIKLAKKKREILSLCNGIRIFNIGLRYMGVGSGGQGAVAPLDSHTWYRCSR